MPSAATLPAPTLAQPADFPELIALLDRTIDHLHAAGIPQWRKGHYPQLRLQGDVAGGTAWVWREAGAIVAAGVLDHLQEAAWATVPFADQSGRHGCLHRLFVDPARQGQGIGRRILAWVEARAVQEGWSSIRLDACAGNPVSNRLYTRLGYQARGRVWFGPVEAIVYERDLPRA